MNPIAYWLDNRVQTPAAQKLMRDCIEATPTDTEWVMQVSSHQEESLPEVQVDGYTVHACLETEGQLHDKFDDKEGYKRLEEKQNYLLSVGFDELWLDNESNGTRAKFWDPKMPLGTNDLDKVREYSKGLTRRTKWYISGWFDDQTPAHAIHTHSQTLALRQKLLNCFDFVGLRFAYGHKGRLLSAKTTNKYWPADYPMTDKYQVVYVNTPYNRWLTAWLLDNVSNGSFMRPVRRCWAAGQIPVIYPGNDGTDNTLAAIKQIQAIVAKG